MAILILTMLLIFTVSSCSGDKDGCTAITANTVAHGNTSGYVGCGSSCNFRYSPFCAGGRTFPLTCVCPVTLLQGWTMSDIWFKLTSKNSEFSSGIAPVNLTLEANATKLGLMLVGGKVALQANGSSLTLECNGRNPHTVGPVTITCNTQVAPATYTFQFDSSLLVIATINTGNNFFKDLFIGFTKSGTFHDVSGMFGSPGHGSGSGFVKPDGTLASGYVEMQNSWSFANIGNYESGDCTFAYQCDKVGFNCYDDTAVHTQSNQVKAAQQNCTLLGNSTGNFSECWQLMEIEQIGKFYRSCIEDMGPYFDIHSKSTPEEKEQEACDKYLRPFMSLCRAYGIRKLGKKIKFQSEPCATQHGCIENSHYEEEASVCINTCVNPYHSSNCPSTRTVPRCVCDWYSEDDEAHYVESEGRCILKSQCFQT